MTAIGIIGAIATIIVAGFGVLMLVVREPRQFHLAEQLAISWLCGVGVVSLLLWIFGFFLSREILFAAVMLSCVCLVAAGWKRHRNFPVRHYRRLTIIERALILVIALQVLVVADLSFADTLGWDGLLNWEIKAHCAFANGGSLPASYFQDAQRAFSHPEYPLAIPFSELWLYFWIGEASQFWAKVIFPVFYLCGVTLLVAIGARLTGKLWAGLVAAIAFFFVPQVTVEPGSVIVAYADVPLSIFFLVAIGYLICAAADQGHADLLRISAACCALLPWVKREGIVLWLAAVLCGALMLWRRKRSLRSLWMFVPGLLIAGGWRVYLRQMHVVTSSDFVAMNFANFAANFHRVGPIAVTFFSKAFDFQAWGIFWFVAILGGFYLARQFRDVRATIVVIAIVAPLVIYGLAYVFSAWPDYHRHIELSLCRLMVHVMPVACLTLPVALGALPSWREAFGRRTSAKTIPTCEEQFPERTAGIDFA